MPIPFSTEERNRIGAKLTVAIGYAFKKGDLTTEEQLQEVSEDILTIIDQIHTREELVEVLSALTEKWPFFSPILDTELTQRKAISNVEEAFKRKETPPSTTHTII